MLGLSAYLAPSLYLNDISQAAWATTFAMMSASFFYLPVSSSGNNKNNM